ncbi:MAG: hypothetical protein ACTSX1_09650 [Candidatus Heimdallarchaeaceae archaeon]
MINVQQALKNNILTFTIIAILAVGLSFVSGLSLKSEIYSLAIPMGIFAVMVCAVGIWKWNQILEQIKLLSWAKAKEKKFNDSDPEDK